VKVGIESGKFYFEGTGNKVGAAYYVSFLAPDLSTVRFARYGANFIPRNAPVIADVDDVNNNVGFWAPQPDFRIPERLSPGFTNFPDLELEAMYEDQNKTFIRYQTQLATRAILKNPGADLVMIYIEEPDGSGHQFTLTDRRQATDFRNPNTIGASQDPQKVARYAQYVKFAYQQADRAVDQIMDLVGSKTDVFVVSDHGMAPFHSAVSLLNLLRNAGVDTSQLAIRTSGSAANVYVNLMGRELNGTVGVAAYQALVNQIGTRHSTIHSSRSASSRRWPSGRSFARRASASAPATSSVRISAMSSRCSTKATISTASRIPESLGSAMRRSIL
jgi:hypothetical protein